MICRKCGNEIDDGSPFCYFCGEQFVKDQEDIGEQSEIEKGWDKIDEHERDIQIMEDAELRRRVSNMIYTTTPNVEGPSIKKYLGIISGSAVVGTGFVSEFGAAISDLFGGSSGSYNSKLNYARDEAMVMLKKEALKKGANAVVGIDTDIMTVGNNMFVVNATGTAVLIEDSIKE